MQKYNPFPPYSYDSTFVYVLPVRFSSTGRVAALDFLKYTTTPVKNNIVRTATDNIKIGLDPDPTEDLLLFTSNWSLERFLVVEPVVVVLGVVVARVRK